MVLHVIPLFVLCDSRKNYNRLTLRVYDIMLVSNYAYDATQYNDHHKRLYVCIISYFNISFDKTFCKYLVLV